MQACLEQAGLNSGLLRACRRVLQHRFAFVCSSYSAIMLRCLHASCSTHVHMYLILSKHAALQVSVDNIDADLFGRGVRGGSFQPSDDTLHAIKSQAIALLTEAYDKDMVRTTPCMPATCKPPACSPSLTTRAWLELCAAFGSVPRGSAEALGCHLLKVVSMYGRHSNSAAVLLQPYLPHHSASCQQSGSLGMRLSQKHVHQNEQGQNSTCSVSQS